MLRRHQSFLSKLYALLDSFMVLVALLLAWFLRFRTNLLPQFQALTFADYMSILLAAVPALVLSSALLGLYGTSRSNSMRTIAWQTVKSAIAMALVVMSVLYFNHQVHYSRAVLFFFVTFTWLLVVGARFTVRLVMRTARRRGFNRKYLLLVGATASSLTFAKRVMAQEDLGYEIVGYVTGDSPAPRTEGRTLTPEPYVPATTGKISSPLREKTLHTLRASADEQAAALRIARHIGLDRLGVPHLGSIASLDSILATRIIDHVVITLANHGDSQLAEVIDIAALHGVHAILVPDFLDILPSRPRFDEFAGLPIVDTHYTPLDDMINAIFKRAFDIVFSCFVLVLGSPLFLILSLLVRWSSPGPVMFSQERLGKNRRPFRMYKFRTMVHEDPDELDTGWTVPGDPRRTPVGRFLRRTSLDELPQFFNVLKGDMSVIGPRPERPYFAERFREDVPKYMIKHRVRPGITGWAQVNGLRGDTSIEERIKYDLRYIEHWTFSWDLRIIGLTMLRGFRDKNAC